MRRRATTAEVNMTYTASVAAVASTTPAAVRALIEDIVGLPEEAPMMTMRGWESPAAPHRIKDGIMRRMVRDGAPDSARALPGERLLTMRPAQTVILRRREAPSRRREFGKGRGGGKRKPAPSFRDGPQDQPSDAHCASGNLETLRCAIAHRSSRF